MAEATPYRRLPGTGYRRMVPGWAILLLFFFAIGIFALLLRGRRVQLWLGADHLLLVESDGRQEFYKRFYYRDIQAVVVHKTSEGKIVNGILTGITCLFLAIAVAVGMEEVAAGIVFVCIAAIFGIALLVNWLSGPTCQTFLRTAVQIEELPSLTRLRQLHKALDQLRPLIVAGQGELPPDEIAARMREVVEGPRQPAPEPIKTIILEEPDAPPRTDPGPAS